MQKIVLSILSLVCQIQTRDKSTFELEHQACGDIPLGAILSLKLYQLSKELAQQMEHARIQTEGS